MWIQRSSVLLKLKLKHYNSIHGCCTNVYDKNKQPLHFESVYNILDNTETIVVDVTMPNKIFFWFNSWTKNQSVEITRCWLHNIEIHQSKLDFIFEYKQDYTDQSTSIEEYLNLPSNKKLLLDTKGVLYFNLFAKNALTYHLNIGNEMSKYHSVS